MLKTSNIESAKAKKDRIRVSGGWRARRDGSELDGVEIDDDEVEGNEVGKKVQKMSKSKKLSKSKKTFRSDFLTSGAKLAFTELEQAFLKGPVLHHFDPKRHI